MNQLLRAYSSRVYYPLTVTYLVFGMIVLVSVQMFVIGQITDMLGESVLHSSEPASAEHSVASLDAVSKIRYVLWVAGFGGFLSVSIMVALFERANKLRAREAETSAKALADLQAMRTLELERIQAERARILESVSHELNTPITSVLAFSSILEKNRDRQLSERDLKHVTALKRNAEHLAFLIKDLINFSEIEDDRSVLHYDSVNMAELATGLVESMEPLANARGQTLHLVTGSSIADVNADPRRMSQVLMSLLNNAINYSPNGSTIKMQVANTSDGVEISVQDNWPGIEPHDQEFVWQPFYRSDNEWTRSQSGSGLGLSLVRKIVEMHGGTVSLTSTPGVGTSFRIVLPRSKGASGLHELSMPA
ncbi:MAG: HAMP domain-containing sensor histidine kinase [Chloroflexi bacterium]|nr:HAMP domain-containing sensor histidine kinase [Chloroflexota bacterium]